MGPLLWNLVYNYLLEVHPKSRCQVYCYADDTIVLASDVTAADARFRVTVHVLAVTRRIEALGLEVAPGKTEAVLYWGRRRPEVDPIVRVGRTYVSMKSHMRYLGVILDSRITFLRHFRNKREGHRCHQCVV